ncbi:MAG: hypothetical protein M1833_005754 [Piccolia ochrophora]|nr:MAG: hypothetical protein M1833_005754 [Piccolia ochrophora]
MSSYEVQPIDGFDFAKLWDIAKNIKKANPDDERLFFPIGPDGLPDRSRTLLTKAACISSNTKGDNFAYYKVSETLDFVLLWKVPLIQLLAQMQRPPLGFGAGLFTMTHLIGDPIDTIWSLSFKLWRCTCQANDWIRLQGEEDWEIFTLIVTSYDEWGEGDRVQTLLSKALKEAEGQDGNDERPILEADATPLKDHRSPKLSGADIVRKACREAALLLAADRATQSIPVSVASLAFIGAIVGAFVKSNNVAPKMSDAVTPHFIAFTVLYFWILPAVVLSAAIGVSQAESAIPEILRRFRNEVASVGDCADLPQEQNLDITTRITSGGIYCWQRGKWNNKRATAFLGCFALLVVASGVGVSSFMSYSAPPVGLGCRTMTSMLFLATWVSSAIYTSALDRSNLGPISTYWGIFAKDLLLTLFIIGENVASHLGMFNRCNCWTNFGNGPLAFALETGVLDDIRRKIHITTKGGVGQWPGAVLGLFFLELLLLVIVAILSWRGISVFLYDADKVMSKPTSKWWRPRHWKPQPNKAGLKKSPTDMKERGQYESVDKSSVSKQSGSQSRQSAGHNQDIAPSS